VASEQGLTFLELLLTVIIAGLAISLAIPGYARLGNEKTAVATVNGFIATLHLARSEAARTGLQVTLCPTSNGETCDQAAGYHAGWLVVSNGDVLRHAPPARTGTTITANGNMARAISYLPGGQTRQLAGTISICSRGVGRQIVINRAGRPRVQPWECADARA